MTVFTAIADWMRDNFVQLDPDNTEVLLIPRLLTDSVMSTFSASTISSVMENTLLAKEEVHFCFSNLHHSPSIKNDGFPSEVSLPSVPPEKSFEYICVLEHGSNLYFIRRETTERP